MATTDTFNHDDDDDDVNDDNDDCEDDYNLTESPRREAILIVFVVSPINKTLPQK